MGGADLMDSKLVIQTCMLAGKLMLESGAETHRVEDTMKRMAEAFGCSSVQSFAMPTGIHFSIDEAKASHFMRVSSRATDLHKIADVNEVSRSLVSGKIAPGEALAHLQEIERSAETYSHTFQIIAAAIVSGSFTIMFGGTWPDFLPSFLTGGIAYAVMLGIVYLIDTRFIADFFASIMIGLLAYVSILIGFGDALDKVIIGAVMPLVPGLPITNAVRDLLAGHLVAGVSKGVEAGLTAVAIGAGVAVMFGVVSLFS